MVLKLNYKVMPTVGGYRVPEPYRGSAGAAGLDMHASLDAPVTLEPGARAIVPLGVAVEIPHGYVGLVFGRSGLGAKHGVTLANSVGVIDEDYRGEIKAAMINRGGEAFTISPGDRICQLVLVPYAAAELCEVAELGDTERGEGGYGSTGVSSKK